MVSKLLIKLIIESNRLIGWVYESDRNAIKEAQDQLDDFYNQDKIDDLEATRDQEKENLQERIDNWNKYLEALQEKFEEQQHLEDERLLQELLNAETEEEIRQKITDDMLAFNERAESGFDEYTGIFDNFIDSYRQNLEELQELSLQMIENLIYLYLPN